MIRSDFKASHNGVLHSQTLFIKIGSSYLVHKFVVRITWTDACGNK